MRKRYLAIALLATLVATPAFGKGAVAAGKAPNCEGLRDMKIAPARIGLPTTGAAITSARMVAASVVKNEPVVAHCLASGVIRPIDPKAPNIEFQVALPIVWNSKALMQGGGGFSGSIPPITARFIGEVSPLARGYAVFGGDSGHQTKPVEPGDFMLNKEAYDNYTGDALKKTHDAALAVIKAAYGQAPRRTYFWGGSTGGREGLLVAGRWPQDWDGVVSRFPALHLITSLLGGHSTVRALAAPGAWMNPAKRGVLFRAAQAACDTLDGAKDGVISNVKGCDATFRPATATLDGAPIRCAGGADTGDACLSDAQIHALEQINAGVQFQFSLASGDTHHPGYNVYTSDNGIPSDSPLEKQVSWLSFGPEPPAFPATAEMTLQTTYGDNFLRYGVGHGDLKFNSLDVDPANPGPYAARLSEMSARDAADMDLSKFAARKGKLLLVQGLADTIISARMTEWYYGRLQQRMGAGKVASFARFYEIAGWNHGFATNFNASVDDLSALDNWVERGVDPAEKLIVRDTTGVPGRTRPLCLYPRWPKYSGSGDVNMASSFSCAAK